MVISTIVNSLPVLLFLALAVSVSSIFLASPAFAEEYEHTVRIPVGAASPSCADDDTCYVPSKIALNEGHEVEWINEDNTAHTVTSGTPQDGHDGLFDSGIIAPRGEFEFKFNGFDVGTYPYYCIVHPWMVGSVTVVDYPVEVIDDEANYESDDSFGDDDKYEREPYSQTSKKSHAKQIILLENQRMFGKYKVTVDWIRELPAVNEINGIEILVSDTTKKSGHGSSGVGCGGGSHGDKGSHGDSMKGKHGGHEGGCPHFQMVKKMIPQIELLESGISQVDISMMMTLSVGNNKLTMPP